MTTTKQGDYATLSEYQLALYRAIAQYRDDCNSAAQSADLNQPYYCSEWPKPYAYCELVSCLHTHQSAKVWTLSNGAERVALQCDACGEKYVNGIKKSDYPNLSELPQFDNELQEQSRQLRNDALGQMSEYLNYKYQEHENKRKELTDLEKHSQNAEWWTKYSQYLNSPEWNDKRRRVLERDNYVCQACLKREATQAHHLTYSRVFNEPLFDLISVCTVCHTALHPHMEAAQ